MVIAERIYFARLAMRMGWKSLAGIPFSWTMGAGWDTKG